MLTSFAYIFLAGIALGYLAQKLSLPSLVGMLIAGFLIGPYALDLISFKVLDISTELRQIALIIILMRAGLALKFSELKRAGLPALLICFIPAIFEIGAMVIFAPRILGISILDAAIMGAVVAAVSPAVIVPKMLRLMDEKAGTKKSIPQMIMAGASVDDIFVITLFTAFTALAQGGEVSTGSFVEIPISILLGIALGSSAGYLLSRYFKAFHMRDSIKLLIMISFSALFLQLEHLLAGIVSVSGLLAIMTMGVTILQIHPTLARRISPKFNKLWVGAEIMLFVLVGASIDINYALDAGANVVILILAVMLVRMIGVYCCMIGSTLNNRERLFCMIAYLPKATVQAAIGSLPLSMGLPCGKIVLTVAVVAIIISAPLGAFGIEASYKYLLKES
ncbi:MAG: cation:proton antiporter [Rikenellaceae bacterium]